jgi:hypothetical protein
MSSLFSDVNLCVIIRQLLDSSFSILPALLARASGDFRYIYTEFLLRKIVYMMYGYLVIIIIITSTISPVRLSGEQFGRYGMLPVEYRLCL